MARDWLSPSTLSTASNGGGLGRKLSERRNFEGPDIEFRNPKGTFLELDCDCDECDECAEMADCRDSRRSPPLCWLSAEPGRLVLSMALSSRAELVGETTRLGGAAKTIELRALLGNEKLGTCTDEEDDGGRVMGEKTRGASETEEPADGERIGVVLRPAC